MPNLPSDRISQPDALRLLPPFMKESRWYAGPRKDLDLIKRLDIRISATGRVTLDRNAFLEWLEELKGELATPERTPKNYRKTPETH
jgi:hypothetical protein